MAGDSVLWIPGEACLGVWAESVHSMVGQQLHAKPVAAGERSSEAQARGLGRVGVSHQESVPRVVQADG